MEKASSSTTPISVPLPCLGAEGQQTAQQHNIRSGPSTSPTKKPRRVVSAPVTTYALFPDGVFLTQGIQSDKKFWALAGVQI